MWLLNVNTKQLERFEGQQTPQYAILSHRWEEEEVSYQEWKACTFRIDGEHKKGYKKVLECCEIVREYDLEYVWVDTCCINKESSAELSEAINSMYNWYRQAEVCLAYLSDINIDFGSQDFTKSVWFTRGWTLQELLAPTNLVFYDNDWNRIGAKTERQIAIGNSTGIPYQAVTRFTPKRYSIAAKLSWAAKRETSREEDRAYSLLGIFGINMPMLYGEGQAAFQRLQEEIVKKSDDRSIFLWDGLANPDFGAFAASPDSFADSSVRPVVKALPMSGITGFAITNVGLAIEACLDPIDPLLSVAYIGSASINGRLHLFGIYVAKDDNYGSSTCFRRVSVARKYWNSVEFDMVDELCLGKINAVIVREPLEDHTVDQSFEFTIRSIPFDCLRIESVRAINSIDHESEPSRHVIRRSKEEGCSFFGSIYGLSLRASLVVITVGIDVSGRPICVIDVWSPRMSKTALRFFNLKDDHAPNYLPIRDADLELELRNTFNSLHDLKSGTEKAPRQGFMLTFCGAKDVDSGFALRSTRFGFHPIMNGFELMIQNVEEAPESADTYAIWPVEHQTCYLNRLGTSAEDYHEHLLRQLRDAQTSVTQKDAEYGGNISNISTNHHTAPIQNS